MAVVWITSAAALTCRPLARCNADAITGSVFGHSVIDTDRVLVFTTAYTTADALVCLRGIHLRYKCAARFATNTFTEHNATLLLSQNPDRAYCFRGTLRPTPLPALCC